MKLAGQSLPQFSDICMTLKQCNHCLFSFLQPAKGSLVSWLLADTSVITTQRAEKHIHYNAMRRGQRDERRADDADRPAAKFKLDVPQRSAPFVRQPLSDGMAQMPRL